MIPSLFISMQCSLGIPMRGCTASSLTYRAVPLVISKLLIKKFN